MNKENIKYIKIANIIESKIQSINYLDDIRLPSERELADSFNVSRLTIRKSLALLDEKNLIIRQQGKGTYINQRKISQPITDSISFSKLAEEHDLISKSELIEAKMTIAGKQDIKLLNINKNESKTILYIARKRYLNKQLVSLEVSYFRNNFSFLLNYDLEKHSIYELIKERGYKLTIQNRMIEIIESDNFLSKQLNVKSGTPILLMVGRIKDQEDCTINYVKEFLLADKFKFEL